MALLTKKKFSFHSKGMENDTFGVVSFEGEEAISRPYQFEILLISEKKNIAPLKVLRNPAIFTIHRDREEDVDFNGILMQFEEMQEFNGYFFFKAVLAPKLWWLSLTHHNQVFLDLTIPEIMQTALEDADLAAGLDFEFRLQNDYQPHEYICQYGESHLNFVSRWAEREGIYYFFEQEAHGEKVVFTDTKISHTDLILGKTLIYLPQSGLDALHTKEVLQDFLCKHSMLPQRVHLKDYNYRKPSLAMEGMAEVDPDGRGENYIYGEHFHSPEEGNRLAEIRAEELLCRKSVFYGKSSVPFMVPGFTFDLTDHYQEVYNRKYLISEVSHEGHQTGYLVSGLGNVLTPRDEQMFYANTFTAIYSDKQFRPEIVSVKPKISGTINARIDAAASGQYAELDEQGRYKVILPFDLSGRYGGKASAWFRMMQPYAGANQGMHFPLHKGTEVMLTFVDGDPDRPFIAGAVPNPETASPVTAGNQTRSVISTGRNHVDTSVGASERVRGDGTDDENFIEFEDLTGEEYIWSYSDGSLWFEAQNRYGEYRVKEAESGFSDKGRSRDELLDEFPASYNPTGMLDRHAKYPDDHDDAGKPVIQTNFYENVFKNAHVHVSSLDTVNTQEGNIYDFGGYWNYNLGNCYVEGHMNQKAIVNARCNVDLLNIGGPDWASIEWTKKPGKCTTLEGITQANLEVGKNEDDESAFANDGVWVNKNFGNSYTLTDGHSIEVTKGDSLEVEHGGTHVELVFRHHGDVGDENHSIRSWNRRHKAGSESKSWNSAGKKLHDSTTTYTGSRTSVIHTTDWTSKHTSTVNFGKSASFSCNFAARASANFNFGATADLNVGFVGSFELKTGVEMGIEIDMRFGGKFVLDPSGGFKFDGIGFQALSQAAAVIEDSKLKAKNQKITLRNLAFAINKNKIRIDKPNLRLTNSKLTLQKSGVYILS